jgi:copper(I)-binding protein
MFLNKLAMIAVASLITVPAFAGDITVTDAYARSSSPVAKSGAAFMTISNAGGDDDQLVAVATEASARVELHTHKETGDGVMKMMKVEDGFTIPAGGDHMLMRGGDHVMLMGLKEPMKDGETVTLTLTFEKAGDVEIDVPIDLSRKPKHSN